MRRQCRRGLSSELYPGDPPAEQTVAALAGGAYAIAWVEAANGGQIHVETFGSNGLPSHAPVVLDLGVGTSTASFIPEREPDITLLDNGNFLVTWTASPSPPVKASADIMGQLFQSDGDALGTPQVLVLGSDGGGFDFSEISPSVTALDNGRFALSWLRLAGNNGDVFIQAFNNDGTRDDDGSINGADVQITANNQTVQNRDPIVTALDDGRFLLSWVSPKTDPSSSPLAPDNTGSQDDILNVSAEPGTGHNLTTAGNVDIELPTKVTLFDNDGSEILQSVTVCKEIDWPYKINKFAVAPSQSCYTKALKYTALSYFRLNNGNIDELKSCLAAGFPFIFGFTIYASFFNADTNGGIVPMPGQERIEGGHAVLAVGYDDGKGRFMIQNSWGASKGERDITTCLTSISQTRSSRMTS